jgi:hypothetical protein
VVNSNILNLPFQPVLHVMLGALFVLGIKLLNVLLVDLLLSWFKAKQFVQTIAEMDTMETLLQTNVKLAKSHAKIVFIVLDLLHHIHVLLVLMDISMILEPGVFLVLFNSVINVRLM